MAAITQRARIEALELRVAALEAQLIQQKQHNVGVNVQHNKRESRWKTPYRERCLRYYEVFGTHPGNTETLRAWEGSFK